MGNRFIAPLILAMTVAIVVLALTSAYNSWVSTSLHSKSCARSDLILDTFHDVILLAFTPPKGETLTAGQVKQITRFEAAAFTRIDQARC